jgi:thiol-disulfide isomerase/thioredoxin
MKWNWIYFCVLQVFIILLSGCTLINDPSNKKLDHQMTSLSKNIGEKFKIERLIDTAGKYCEINLNQSEFTIVDFWFNECPPCNEEMSQFAALLKSQEAKIQIISISVSSFNNWKALFLNPGQRYSFLLDSLPNWQQLALASNDNPALKNPISLDRLSELQIRLNVTFFPSYFVLDKRGIIIARPISAVGYIKKYLLREIN